MSLASHYKNLIAEGTISPDEAQASAISVFDNFIKEARLSHGLISRLFKSHADQTPSGLYLWGGVGRGKTMLMDMAFEVMVKQKIKAKRLHFHEFMVEVHNSTHEPSLQKHDDAARYVAATIADGAKVLCLDEMEIRDIADAMIIARVMEGFMEAGGVLITTSNRAPDDLYKGGLHRERFLPFIALLKERLTIHEIKSKHDWRQSRLKDLRCWFEGEDAETLPLMEEAFTQLTSGIAPTPEIITVAGRCITLPKISNSIAFAHFDDLCGKALAARDYLVIAERIKGLFLVGIPRLDDNLQNEARRFIWLIDALYDRGRFVVASAHAPMADLYQGTQWQAEFPRTLSRLKEMTSNFVSQNRD